MGRLFDLDPSLVEGRLPGATTDTAETARVLFLTVRPGPWSPESVPAALIPPFALLVADGLVVHHVWLGESGSSELLGPGDLISPHEGVDPIVPLRHTWHVANTARLGVLDARVTAIFGAAPNVAANPWVRFTCSRRASSGTSATD